METSSDDKKDHAPPPYYMQANSAYSAQPAEYNPNVLYSPVAPQQPQQQSVVVITSSPPVVNQPASYESYSCHIALACVVVWVFNLVFGLVAYYLASE
jgi:hypothetical protein